MFDKYNRPVRIIFHVTKTKNTKNAVNSILDRFTLTDKFSEINDDTCWNQYIFFPEEMNFQNISTLFECIFCFL